MNIAIIPAAWTPYLQAILRIMIGLLFLEHGASKIVGFPAVPGVEHVAPQGMVLFTGLMELIGGALFAVGFLTRPVAFLLSGFMAVAYFMAHFPAGFFPLLNHGELAIVYCFTFLYFAAAGPSVWAIDKA